MYMLRVALQGKNVALRDAIFLKRFLLSEAKYMYNVYWSRTCTSNRQCNSNIQCIYKVPVTLYRRDE